MELGKGDYAEVYSCLQVYVSVIVYVYRRWRLPAQVTIDLVWAILWTEQKN